MLDLANFLPHGGDYNEPVPLKAAMADSCDTIVILYTIAEILCLAYLNPLRGEPTNYMIHDFMPTGNGHLK